MAKRSWYKAELHDDETAKIAILSDIGAFGVTTQDFADSLAGLGAPKTIDLTISSDGGDVTVGFAIFNMLNRHAARKVVTVQGLAASMASVIAMAGRFQIY